jgi:hypothetical protein
MSIDQFPISTPESPSYKSILWRRSIVRHLENLQRKGGFKGFNQHAVSIIIAETDPRKQTTPDR